MKTIKKNVYYCEHCNKRSLSASTTGKHEKHCTANPNRYCKLCERTDIKILIDEFKNRFVLQENLFDPFHNPYEEDSYKVKWVGDPVTLKEIKDAVDDCPNCVFAILRQVKFNHHYFHFEKYDYRKELSEALSERNAERYKEEAYWDC